MSNRSRGLRRVSPNGIGRWSAYLALILAGIESVGVRASLGAQEASEAAVPSVISSLEGAWVGAGVLMNRAGAFHMEWEVRPEGFVRLVFSNAFVSDGGASTPVLSAEATYYLRGLSAVGVWVDSRPQQLTLSATLTDSTVVTEWTAAEERGRTEYIVRSSEVVVVRDFVFDGADYQVFAEATYRRESLRRP